MDAGALRDETPLIALGLRVAVFIVGVALVATIVAEPLGVLEAPALARLHTLVAPGQSLWAGLVDCFAAAQPALNLAVSAVLSSLGTGDELALRAADVVALVGLIAAVLMRARSDNPRRLIFAGLLVASPLFWAAPVVVTGWGGEHGGAISALSPGDKRHTERDSTRHRGVVDSGPGRQRGRAGCYRCVAGRHVAQRILERSLAGAGTGSERIVLVSGVGWAAADRSAWSAQRQSLDRQPSGDSQCAGGGRVDGVARAG
ncbi:hypothetical protein [uncultured Salinisphaera sp.]|uniref:hypothetical protein n=1 Tax=uncultured Salinisphaera sp. TaxID=359372 RepID=UPI0032B105ED|tara:strand:- start:3536 stop:4312 length:777 start_codon:yes stop_codon:yes gene_type:complete